MPFTKPPNVGDKFTHRNWPNRVFTVVAIGRRGLLATFDTDDEIAFAADAAAIQPYAPPPERHAFLVTTELRPARIAERYFPADDHHGRYPEIYVATFDHDTPNHVVVGIRKHD